MKKTVLIIGSSLAGIATALRLSKRGYQVTMIEKNGTPGGRLNRISRDGFIFDVGPTFFSMSYEFEELAKDCAIQLPFKYYPVNPLYQVSYGKGGRTYTIHRDICALAKEFSQEEPDFETQMQRYLAKTGKLFHDSLDIVVRQNFSSKLHYLQELSKINKRHLPLLFSSVQQVVNNHFSSDEVRNIISLPAYFLGNTPAKTNGVYSLLSYTEFLHDGYHNVEGGMYQIVQGLMQELKKSGVETIFDTEITGVERIGNKLTALTDQNGKRYVADQFVVNCDSLLFRSRVLQQKKYTEKNLQKYDWSMGMLTIYIGLECKLDHVALHNYYIGHNHQDQIGRQSPDRQIDKPYFYVNVPSLYNPNCAPEGCESLMFVVPVPNLLLKKEWQDQERIVNDVLREFSERIGLDIFPFIRVKEYYTPENWRDLYNLYSGAALGITHSMSQTGAFRPANIDDEYNNLYYTGASTVPGIGLPMAIISSRLTTERVIGEKITAQYD